MPRISTSAPIVRTAVTTAITTLLRPPPPLRPLVDAFLEPAGCM